MVQAHHDLSMMTYNRRLGYCDPCSCGLGEKGNASNGGQRLYIYVLPSEYFVCSPCCNSHGLQVSCVFPWYRMRFNYCSPCYNYNWQRPSYRCRPFCHTLRSRDCTPGYGPISRYGLTRCSYNYSPCYGPKTRCYSPCYSSKTTGCARSSRNNQSTNRYGSPSSSCSSYYSTETVGGTPCSSCYDSRSSSCCSCYNFKTKGRTPCYNNHQHSPCHRCFSPYYTSRSRCWSPGYTYTRCSPCCSSTCYSPHYSSGSKRRTPIYRYSQCLPCHRSRCHSPYYLFGSRCGAPSHRNNDHLPCQGAGSRCYSPSRSSTCSSSHFTSCTHSMKSGSSSTGCRRCSCPW